MFALSAANVVSGTRQAVGEKKTYDHGVLHRTRNSSCSMFFQEVAHSISPISLITDFPI
jgi:hypothetical protein